MSGEKNRHPNTAAVCAELAAPVAAGLGVYLWDTVFEKEGAGWYLRYFIDSEDGVGIDECEEFSRQISDLLDEADPILQSYTLEVGSPGIERKLTKDWHFQKYIGSQVLIRLIRPAENGEREFIGVLLEQIDNTVSIDPGEGAAQKIDLAETAFVRLYEEF